MTDEANPTIPAADELDLLDTPTAGSMAIRGGVLRVVGYVVGVLLSVASVPLLIRHLGVADYGRYVTVISLVTIVQGITDVGLSQIGVREFATRSGAARDRLMRNLLAVRVALTSGGVTVAVAFALLSGYGHAVVTGTLLAGFAMVLTVLQGTFSVPLAARLRLGWITALDLLRQALSVTGVVILVLAGAKLLAFLALSVPVAVVVLVATGLLMRNTMPLTPSFQWAEWALLLRAILPFAAAIVIGTIYLRVTVIVMSLLASAVQTGYYATSYTVVSVLIAIPALTVGSTLPVLARAARDDHERLTYGLQRLFEVTAIVGVWLGLALALGAGFVIHVLTNAKSSISVEVLEIQSLALVTQFVASTWQYGLLSLHRHRALLFISIASLAVSVCLTLILVPLLQARGAALAFSGAEIVLAASSFALLKVARRDVRFSLRVPARVVAAAVLAAGVVLVPGLTSLLRALIASVVYFVVLIAMRAIPAELTQALLRRPHLTKP